MKSLKKVYGRAAFMAAVTILMVSEESGANRVQPKIFPVDFSIIAFCRPVVSPRVFARGIAMTGNLFMSASPFSDGSKLDN